MLEGHVVLSLLASGSLWPGCLVLPSAKTPHSGLRVIADTGSNRNPENLPPLPCSLPRPIPLLLLECCCDYSLYIKGFLY